LDSASTTILILLTGSALAFLGLYAAETALPLIRRSQVRDALPEQGLRGAAVRGLRADRGAYQELIRLLSISSLAATSALALGFLARATELTWPLMVLVLAGVLAGLLGSLPLVRAVIMGLSVARLMAVAIAIQVSLWPFAPLRQVSRQLFRATPIQAEQTPGPAVPTGTAEPDGEPTVEEQIADEPLEPRERLMIQAILQLEETTVREIMVPRVDVDAVEIDWSLADVVARMLDTSHSRLPIYEGDQDNVVGIIHSRDLLAALTGTSEQSPVLRELARPAFFVPESKRADEALTEMQKKRVQIAVVVDEYGGVAGLVTIEDLLEEIVGEIEDEFDVSEPTIEYQRAGEALVDARISAEAFNEAFSTDINPEGFDTLGGFLNSRLGKIANVGDVVTVSGLIIDVLSTAGRRIKKVRVHQAAVEPAIESEASTGQEN